MEEHTPGTIVLVQYDARSESTLFGGYFSRV
jgi:hypothetical protein